MSTNINSTEQIVEINAGDQITNVNIVSQSTTQVISGEQVVTVDVNAGTIPAAWGSITGTLSNQTDLQNALNAKQNNITLTTTGTTGVATLVGATLNIPNYVTSTKQSQWDSAYNDKINSAEVSGTTTKTLTLTQQDGGIIQASWSDFDTAPVTSVFGRTGDVVATEGDYNINQLGDVTITSATNGQVLKYNGTAWVNAADASGLTSVGLAMPSAFTVSGSPLTSNGTITVTGAGTTSQYVRGDGSLANFPSVSNEAKTLIREVYNKTGATLTKGTVIYIDGGQGNLPTVTKAIATGDPTSAQTFGIVQSDITNMNNGFVVVAGGIDNLDTQAYTEGTALYLSPTTAGAWTSTKPYAPDHMVYLGVVVRSHPTQGVIEVKIQNGVELDEIHDVSARFPVNKDGLFYNSTSGVWENKSISGVLGYTPVPETRIITINGTAQNLSADRTWSVGTVTSVAASGGTGISVAGSPVTGSGTITITNTAPDQVVGLTGAGTTSISGTYPNFTITSNDQYTGTVTSVAASGGTGISISGSPITSSGTINITNTAPDQIVSLTGAGTTLISGTYPNFTVTSNDQYVGTVTSVNATVPTGFEVSGVPITSSGTVDIKFASGYSLPTNAKQTQWDDAYAKRIDSLTVTGNSGSATLTSNVLNVPTYTLTGLGGEPAITAGTTSQYWRGDKSFQTLDTSVVPENGNVYFTEPRVRATVLSGLNITGGSISASDSVLNAFGKIQNQINGLIGGSIFQSTWNASTNTPALASGVGTKGYYYIVSVAGTTNLDGITDWQIGDWAIFDGTVWRKVDNTDAVVSVNGYTGVVNLVLDDLADVSAASPTSNQLLRYNGTSSKWENWTPTFLNSLNGITNATQTFATGTSGTDFNISSSGTTHTFNIPSASATNRGLVTTGTQTFAGDKTISGSLIVSSSSSTFTGASHRLFINRLDNTNVGSIIFSTNGASIGNGWAEIGQTNANGDLYFKTNATAGTFTDSTMILKSDRSIQVPYYTTNGFVKTSSANGTLIIDNTSYQPLLTNPVTGTGTNNYIAKFTTTGSTIGNSNIFDDGTSVVVNHNAKINIFTTSSAQYSPLEIITSGTLGASISQFSADTGGGYLIYTKSRNATTGSHTVVQTGDVLGNILFRGSDGTNYIDSSRIFAQVEGTVGTDNVKSGLYFQTGTGNGYATRLQISNTGNIVFNAYTTNGILKVTGSAGTVDLAVAGTDYVAPSALSAYVTIATAQTITGAKTFNENIKINTDTDPTNLDGKQLVLRGNSVNGGQSVMAFQGYDKTTRWVLNVQDNVDSYNYVLFSNTVTVGSTPSYNPKFLLSQAGVLRLHNYTTNGLAAFTNSDGTIASVARTINGVTFDGSGNITITANTTNAITFNDGGAGAASGTTFNGGTARTISYNTIGAQAALTNPVTGTGTQHYLTKFTATGSAIGDSTITNNGRLTAFESNQNNGTEFRIKNTTAGTVAQPYITLEGESGSRFFNFGKLSSGWVADARFSAGDSYIYSGTANLVIYNESAQIRMMSDGVTSQHFRISSSIPISVGNDTTSGGRIEFYRNSTPTQAGSIGNGFSGTISDDTVIATYNATSNWRRRVTIFNRTTASTRVSIGGTNSDFGLSIEGSAIGDAAIALNNTSADGAKWNIYSTGTGFSQGNKKLLFYRDGVDADGGTAVLDWDGRFGLGMVSPSHMIDVLKTQNADSVIRIRNANAGTSAAAQFFASNDTNQTQFFHTGTGWTSGAGVTAPASMGGIYSSGTGIALSAVSASGYIVFGTGTSQTERARINSAGLTVKSNDATNSIRLGSIAASPEYNCVSLNGSIAEGQYIGIAGGGGTDTSLYFQTGNGGSHIFRTGNGTSYVTRAFIQNGGGLKYLSSSNPTSGNGMELWFNGTSLIGSYDRDASVYRNMQLYAANIIFEIGGVEAGRFHSSRNFVAGPDGAATTARLTSYLGSTALVANTSNDGLRLQVQSYNDGSRNTIAWGQNGSDLTLGRFGIAWNNGTSQMCFVWRDMYNGAAGSTEIMRLTGGGKLGIGVDPNAKLEVKYDGANGNLGAYGDYNILATSATTSQSYQATIGAIHTGGGYANLNLGDTDSGTTRFWHISKRLSSSNDQGAGARSLTYYWNNGSGFTAVFSFSTGGNLYAAGGYFESSDIRLKTVIERNPLIDLNVDVIKFTKHGQEGIRYGYSAQEVQAIAPELVTDGEYLQLNYTDVHTLKIAKLEAEVKSLKEQLKNK